MANYNKIILVGNLTRDPQMRYLPSQLPVTDFGLAVNNKYKTKSGEDREEVLFIDCSIFGRGAEVINQYCQKGKQILVEGRLKFDTWEDKQGGGKRSKHSVLVDQFQFLGGRDSSGAGSAAESGEEQSRPPRQPAQRGPAPPRPAPSAPPAEQPYGNEEHFKDDDIPF